MRLTSSSPSSAASSATDRRARREAERRSRRSAARRPVLVAGGLALAALATVGVTGNAPASMASAAGTEPRFSLASFTTAAAMVDATVAASDTTASAITTQASEALSAAEATLASASSVTTDIAASGLDVGEPAPSVDTAALAAAVERLQNAEALPEPFLPDLTDDVTAAMAPVGERVASLRGALEGAQQRKAEEEAAEKERQEAEAAAAAAAKAAEEEAQSARAAAPAAAPVAPAAASASAAEAQAIARGMLGSRGWGDDQFSCLVSLWHKESGWNVHAQNRSSGAYGIPQALPGSKMASAGADWQTNAATQISWGFGYIGSRYGTPCGAWQHSQSVGWY